MRQHRPDSAAWWSALVGSLGFGVAFGAFVRHDGASWVEAAVTGLAAGVFFGVAMGRWSALWMRTMRTAEADLPPDQAKLAHRAAAGGPVPGDPRIRSAALDIAIAQQALEPRGRSRVFLLVMAPVIAASSVYGAITASPWNLILVPAPVFMIYGAWIAPRRTQRRIDLLSQSDG